MSRFATSTTGVVGRFTLYSEASEEEQKRFGEVSICTQGVRHRQHCSEVDCGGGFFRKVILTDREEKEFLLARLKGEVV